MHSTRTVQLRHICIKFLFLSLFDNSAELLATHAFALLPSRSAVSQVSLSLTSCQLSSFSVGRNHQQGRGRRAREE